MPRRVALLCVLLIACSSGAGGGSGPTGFTVEVSVESLREDAGRVDAVATVVLDAPAVEPVDVSLWSEDAPVLRPTPERLTIAAGETRAVVGVTLADDEVLGPDWIGVVQLEALGRSGRFELPIVEDEPRGLTLEGSALSEGSGQATLTLRADAPLAEAVDVVLAAEPAGLVTLPERLTLAAHDAAWPVTVELPDDALLEGPRTVTFSATPERLLDPADPLTLSLVDDEPATLTLEALAQDVTEGDGEVAQGLRLTVGAPVADDLTVSLATDAPDVVAVPAEVTVPAGAQQVELALTVVDDAVLDGDAVANLTATAEGFEPATVAIAVADDEVAGLEVSLDASTLGEGAGDPAASGTVSLGVVVAADHTVALASSDESELTVPATVVVPAGADRATFAVHVVDDALLDFDVPVTVSASLDALEAEAQVTVTDDEPHALTVTISNDPVYEDSGTMFGVITVSTAAPVERRLDLEVTASDPGTLQLQLVPAIEAGADATDVSLYPRVDGVPDLDQPVQITASAPGCETGTGTVLVRDADSGYVLDLLQSPGVEQWVAFPAMQGLMFDTDWALAERFMIPVGADTAGYQMFRGSAWLDLTGDFAVNVHVTDPQVNHFNLPMHMNAGQNGVTLTEGTWHTLVVQYETATNVASLWVDGVFMDQGIVAAWDDRDNDHPLVWGGQYAEPQMGVGELYLETDASFAHMAIWQRTLTPAEIAAYDGTVNLADPDLYFATAVGPDRVYDLVGGRDGAVHGAPTFRRP